MTLNVDFHLQHSVQQISFGVLGALYCVFFCVLLWRWLRGAWHQGRSFGSGGMLIIVGFALYAAARGAVLVAVAVKRELTHLELIFPGSLYLALKALLIFQWSRYYNQLRALRCKEETRLFSHAITVLVVVCAVMLCGLCTAAVFHRAVLLSVASFVDAAGCGIAGGGLILLGALLHREGSAASHEGHNATKHCLPSLVCCELPNDLHRRAVLCSAILGLYSCVRCVLVVLNITLFNNSLGDHMWAVIVVFFSLELTALVASVTFLLGPPRQGSIERVTTPPRGLTGAHEAAKRYSGGYVTYHPYGSIDAEERDCPTPVVDSENDEW